MSLVAGQIRFIKTLTKFPRVLRVGYNAQELRMFITVGATLGLCRKQLLFMA